MKPTTTTRPPSASERSESVKRSPPTGSMTRSTPPPESSFASSLHSPSERTTSSAPASRATRFLLVGGDHGDHARAEPLRDLDRGGPDAAGGAVDEDGLALLEPAAGHQREPGRVVVEDQRRALAHVEGVGQREREEVGRDGDLGEAAEHRERGDPLARRSRPEPSGAERTVPATSLPGTNGRSGLNWYSPRVCSTSGKETPAASTSTSTPDPGESMCEASGSGTSTTSSAESGPVRSTICTAFKTSEPTGPPEPAQGGRGRRVAPVGGPHGPRPWG